MRSPAWSGENTVVPIVARNVALDRLRVVLAIMVVGLHGHFLMDVSPIASNMLENYLFRVAVPLFFIINGFFFFQLLDRGGSPARWLTRIATLYITWSLIYSYFIFSDGLLAGLKLMVLGYWHLWYLPATLLAAMLMLALRNWRARNLLISFAGLYVVGLTLMYAGNYHLFSGPIDEALNKSYIYRNFLFFGFPMFGLGFLIARSGPTPSVTTLSSALGAGFLAMTVEFCSNRIAGAALSEGFDMLFSLPLVCVPAFLLLVRVRPAPSSWNLAGLSAVIYFAHPLFLLILPTVGIASATPLVLAAVLGSCAIYPSIAALNRRWPVFI